MQFYCALQFELVCQRDIFPTIGLAALNTGGPIGVYLFGVLNDRWVIHHFGPLKGQSRNNFTFVLRVGRKLSFFMCLATLIVGGMLTAFAQDFWSWALCRLVVGFTVPAVYQIPFIICKVLNYYIAPKSISLLFFHFFLSFFF